MEWKSHRQKTRVSHRILVSGLVTVVICFSLLAGKVMADASLPLSYQSLGRAFKNMPGSTWAAVQQEAQSKIASRPHKGKSNAAEKMAFAGYFQAEAVGTHLALFSDGSADVYIDGRKVHSGYQNSRALPDLPHSLSPINYTFNPTHIYFIKIICPHTILTSSADIDGVTLFCYGDGGNLINLNASILVKRAGSRNAWSSSAIVAAGARRSREHEADVQITMRNGRDRASGVYVDTPRITAGGQGPNDPPHNISAVIRLISNFTDNNGVVNGLFTSGHRTETTQITAYSAAGSHAIATLTQVWNENGSPWNQDAYFDYDVPTKISYEMDFSDEANTTIPITRHRMSFITTAISGVEWNAAAGDYEPVRYTGSEIKANGYDGIVKWGRMTESDGVYSAQRTIASVYRSKIKKYRVKNSNGRKRAYPIDFFADSVSFDIDDNDAYDAK